MAVRIPASVRGGLVAVTDRNTTWVCCCRKTARRIYFLVKDLTCIVGREGCCKSGTEHREICAALVRIAERCERSR